MRVAVHAVGVVPSSARRHRFETLLSKLSTKTEIGKVGIGKVWLKGDVSKEKRSTEEKPHSRSTN